MEPWYKVAMPRKEVREGRSFNPDEFAIALEQVVAGTANQSCLDRSTSTSPRPAIEFLRVEQIPFPFRNR